MSQRWSPRWLRSSQTSSSSTTNGSSSSKSFLWSEAALSDFKAVHYILPSTSIENPGERHCCNLRQLQLRNHLEVWPLSALAIQEAGIQVSNLSWYFLEKHMVLSGMWVTARRRTMQYGLFGERDAQWNADQRHTRTGNTVEQWTYSTDLRLAFEKTTSQELRDNQWIKRQGWIRKVHYNPCLALKFTFNGFASRMQNLVKQRPA